MCIVDVWMCFSSDLLFCNFHTVPQHMTDRKPPRGPFHHPSDGVQRTTRPQMTWTHPPPLSWFRWWWLDDKVYSFLKVRPTHSPTMSSLRNNPSWEYTTPCGHFVTGMEPHLWNMSGTMDSYGFVSWGLCAKWSLNLIWMQNIKVWLRHFLMSLHYFTLLLL